MTILNSMRFLLFFLMFQKPIFSQESKILDLLNSELQKEVAFQKENPDAYEGIPFDLIQEFSIENGVLRLELKLKKYYSDEYFVWIQEVELSKITSISKDVSIIFETVNLDVLTTSIDSNDKKIDNKDLFFTYLSKEKDNKHFGEELIRAFKKAGYSITISAWFD